MEKSFAVIGLGRFGSAVARYLYQLDYDVMAIDQDEEKIQEHMNYVTHAVQADSTDEEAMKALGIRNFDVVVVAIGEDIQASILTTLILKELGVPMLVVKAQNDQHGKVLDKIGADKVVYPEFDMGRRLAHSLISSNILDHIELAKDYSIIEIRAPQEMVGKTLVQLDFRRRFGCYVMAMKQGKRFNIAPQAEDLIHEGDILVVLGHNQDLKKLEEFSQ